MSYEENTILKWNTDDTSGVVGQQTFETKAKVEKLTTWQMTDNLNKLRQFELSIPNNDYNQANALVERIAYFPFLTPFRGIITGRALTPSLINLQIQELAYHLTRKIFTKDDEKKHNWTDKNWYNVSWLHRRKVLLTRTKIKDEVKDAPVLVHLTNTSFKNRAQSDGDDFICTDKDGITVIPHEIHSYDSTTGDLILWVKVPKISDNTDSNFYIYYGNSGATNQENPTALWNSCYTVKNGDAVITYDYEGVWHLEEDSLDSTSNNNDGTDTSITYTTGKFGDAATFDGANSKIECGSDASLDNTFNTGGWVSAWIYPNSDGENDEGNIISKGNGSTTGWHIAIKSEAAGFVKLHLEHHFSSNHGVWESTSADIPLSQWSKIDIVYDNSNVANDPQFWINGVEVAITESSTPAGTAQTDSAESIVIGNTTAQDRTFDGKISDVRLLKDPNADSDAIIPSLYNIESDNTTAIFPHEHEEYKAAANVIAQDMLDSANADTTMPVTWTLDQDFPVTVVSLKLDYKDHFEGLHKLGEIVGKDVWFDNKNYIVYMGQKGKTLEDELDITITSDPEITTNNFANEINVLGSKDDISQLQQIKTVLETTNLRYDYEEFVSDTKLEDDSQLTAVADQLLSEFAKLTPTITGNVPFSQYEKYNLQSGDIIPIYQPDKQIKGSFRIMDIEVSPQNVKLNLESTETGVIRLRSVSLTGVIEGILIKLQDQSIE